MKLASDGVSVTAGATWEDVRAYKILDDSGNKIGTYEGQVYSGMHELRCHVPSRTGESSQFDVLVECPAATYASKFIVQCIRTGVLNLTFLLKSRDGQAYAVSAGWNNPKEVLDEARFFALAQSVLHLLAKKE